MPVKGKGKNVTQKELADLLGVTSRTVSRWADDGCPIVERGGRGQSNVYNTAAVFEWRVKAAEASGNESGNTLEQVNIRRALIKEEDEKIDLDVKKKLYAAIADVAKLVGDEYAVVRGKFLSMPGEMSADLEHKEAQEVEEILSTKVTEILTELTADVKYSSGGSSREGEGGKP